MANITPSTPISIETELGNLSQYKYFPNKIVSITLNRLTDMLNGAVDIVDPSNPFTYLLETSCLNTAFAIQEYTLACRKLYPRLANNESDLYLHMSDYDYQGIFSEPAYANINFNILLNDFTSKAYYDPILQQTILKIPRNYSISVDKYIFTLPSAIIIKQSETGVIDVVYENQTYNNIFPVQTNHIDFNVVRVNQQETYIRFTVPAPEVEIEATEVAVEKSTLFKNTLNFNQNRLFYFFRAFYYTNNAWKEMTVTNSNEIYDINTPTCIINVLKNEKQVQYYIPPVYVNNILTNTRVKFLIYTTNGPIDINFNNFNLTDFTGSYSNVFPDVELDQTTTSLELIGKVIYIQDTVIGGKGELSFQEVKQSVIDNSIGDRKLPITSKQLEFYVNQNNFNIISDVDTLTNRIYLLSSNLPRATTRYPITKINMDIIEYVSTINDIRGKNNTFTYDKYITVIKKGAVFNLTNNGLYMLTPQEFDTLSSMSGLSLVNTVNSNRYINTFYHYIMDTTDSVFSFRGYDIESPSVSNINFRIFNDRSQIGVNTSSISIDKTQTGYRITLNSSVKLYNSGISVNDISVYLVYETPDGGLFYLQGSLYTTIQNNPVYIFDLVTDYVIDSNNKMLFNSFVDNNNRQSYIWCDLKSDLKVIYLSDVIPDNYLPSDIERYTNSSFLHINKATVTLEDITVNFGYSLDRLFTRAHSSTTSPAYLTYTQDIIATYEHNVYDSNNDIIHSVGDIVLDQDAVPVIKYHKGDVILDSNGNPTPIADNDILRYINMVFIDYRATLSTNPDTLNYINYLRDYLTSNIVSNAVTIQDNLLENTQCFVVIPKNIDIIEVTTDTLTYQIPSMQSVTVTVYVNSSVYMDNNIRDTITYNVISYIDSYLYNNSTLIKTELLDLIYSNLKDYIKSVSIDQFTQLNKEYMVVSQNNARISLNKKLVSDVTGYNITEDVTVNFVQV